MSMTIRNKLAFLVIKGAFPKEETDGFIQKSSMFISHIYPDRQEIVN